MKWNHLCFVSLSWRYCLLYTSINEFSFSLQKTSLHFTKSQTIFPVFLRNTLLFYHLQQFLNIIPPTPPIIPHFLYCSLNFVSHKIWYVHGSLIIFRTRAVSCIAFAHLSSCSSSIGLASNLMLLILRAL